MSQKSPGSHNKSQETRYLIQVHYSHRTIAQRFSPFPFAYNQELLARANERQLRLLGTTGGATLDAAGAGTVSFTSATFGAPGAGAKTLTLTGSNTGANTVAGVIADNSATKQNSVEVSRARSTV